MREDSSRTVSPGSLAVFLISAFLSVMLAASILAEVSVGTERVAQSCRTLCDPVDCSPPGCSVCGILQARPLEWVAISSSRASGDGD